MKGEIWGISTTITFPPFLILDKEREGQSQGDTKKNNTLPPSPQ